MSHFASAQQCTNVTSRHLAFTIFFFERSESESDCSDDQVTDDFETAYARAMSEYERDLRLRQVGRIESKSE